MTSSARPSTASPLQFLAQPLRPLRSLFALLLLATTFLITTLLAQVPSAYLRGKEALAQQRYAEAADLFAAATTEPNPPTDTLLLEARALLNAERLPEAERVLRAYLATNSRSAPGLYLLGDLLLRQNHPRESLETYTRAAALQTPTAEDLRHVALDYVLLNSYPDARRWLTRALAMDPRNAEALYDLGRIDMHDGDFHAAQQHFEASLTLNPNALRTLDNLGLTLEALNRPADALTSYDRAIAAQQTSARPSEQPLLNRGALLITLNRAAEAIPSLRRAAEIAPRCVRCHEELARALAATSQLPPAIGQLREAVELEPANPRLHFQLGQLLRRAGLNAEADRELKQSSTLYGTQSSAPNP